MGSGLADSMTNLNGTEPSSNIKFYLCIISGTTLWVSGWMLAFGLQFVGSTNLGIPLKVIAFALYFNCFWRFVFLYYEILFIFTINTNVKLIRFNSENITTTSFENFEILNRNIESFTDGFGWFLFLDFTYLCVWWILM